MTDREKLIELLETVPHAQRLHPDLYVDHRILNGVTVSVLCKDCRHWIERTADGIDTFHTCWFNDSITARTHFCRYGERKDNG